MSSGRETGTRPLARRPLGSENHGMDFIAFGVTGLALIVYGVAGVILFYVGSAPVTRRSSVPGTPLIFRTDRPSVWSSEP